MSKSTLHRIPLRTQVADLLRKEIRTKFKPGQRLETELQLVKRLGVSLITIKEALGVLSHQGIIVRKQGKGTFVCEEAPPSSTSLRKVALVSDLTLDRYQSSTYFLSVLTKTQQRLAAQGLSCRLYLGLNGPPDAVLHANPTKAFFDDLAGGLVEAVVASGLTPTPLILDAFARYSVPVVATDERFPHFSVPDGRALLLAGIQQLIARGCVRIGIIDHSTANADVPALILAGNPSVTTQVLHHHYSEDDFSASLERELTSAPGFDALILIDDFQMPGVLSAMNSRGIRTPEDVLLCVHYNLGAKEPTIPCLLMEVDTDAIATDLCALVQDQLTGSGTMASTVQPPRTRAHLLAQLDPVAV